jgi:hypothetical protein
MRDIRIVHLKHGVLQSAQFASWLVIESEDYYILEPRSKQYVDVISGCFDTSAMYTGMMLRLSNKIIWAHCREPRDTGPDTTVGDA